VTLILENGHYNYINQNPQLPLIYNSSDLKANSNTKENPHSKEHNKPNLVIPFKSTNCALKIKQFKSLLKTSNLFNICFKTEGKLIDIVRKIQSDYKKLNENKTASTPMKNTGINTHLNQHSNQDNNSGIVYMATCLKCKDTNIVTNYVGETGRSLSIRKKEHLSILKSNNTTDKSSPIGLHQLKQHGSQPNNKDWDFKILCRASRTQHRKALEAFMIRKFNPNLNRDSGVYIII
jgi:hypothetical protein